MNVVASTVKGIVKDGTNYFKDIDKINKENKELKEELNEAKLKLVESERIEIENSDLREA